MNSDGKYYLLGSLWALSLFFLAIPGQTFAQQEPIGKVVHIVGTAEYLVGEPVAQAKPGEVIPASLEVWEKVKFHQPIYLNDKLRTKRRSRVKILFKDNSLMGLGPGGEMSVAVYLHKPKDKLRQGVINIRRGISMYIINKSQKNKKSFFKMSTPSGNISARGTHGYIAATSDLYQDAAVSIRRSAPIS